MQPDRALAQRVSTKSTYEELGMLETAAKELGLGDAEELIASVLHKAAEVKRDVWRSPMRRERQGRQSGRDEGRGE